MAGLIPRSFVDDLLERVDIVEVIGQRVALKKAGRSFKACCPFHDEKTPSFNVNPDKQFFHCFGCGAGGNVIGFLMDYENIDFPTAVEILAQNVGLDVPREESPKAQARAKQSEGLYDILQAAARYYQGVLRNHAERERAVTYLQGRGLSGELARDFGIGFAPPGWDNLIKNLTAECKDQQEKLSKLALMEKAGLIVAKEGKPGQYYDRFRDRVIFPIRDARGRVIAFGGRVLGDEKPKYLNSPETEVFHKSRELYGLYEARKRNRQLDYLLMVEGYMDVVSLFQYDINCAIATLGTASSVQHLEKIYRYTSLLVICFDGDEAGRKAARRLMELALPTLKDGREIRFLFLESGEDPDTYVRKHGRDAFQASVDSALPLERFLFEEEASGVDLQSEAGKAVYSSRLLPFIRQLPEGIYRQRLLSRLADELGLSVEFLARQMAAIKTPKMATAQSVPGAAPQTSSDKARKTGSSRAFSGQGPRLEASANYHQSIRYDGSGYEGEGEKPSAKSLVWALRALLHYPELAIERELPDLVVQSNVPAAQLLRDIADYIVSRHRDIGRVPDTSWILGHWHDTEQEPLLLACIGSEHQIPDTLELARNELAESLESWGEEQAEQQQRDQLSRLLAKPFHTLTTEEIDLLKNFSADQLAKKSGEKTD